MAAKSPRRPPRGFGSWSAYNRWRVQKGVERGLTRSQALGHPRQGEDRASEVLGRPKWTVTVFAGSAEVAVFDADYRTAQRAGRYMALARRLVEGRISPAEFKQRAARMKPIGGLKLVSDPRVVLALAVTTDDKDLIFESGGQPNRRRRAA